MWDVRWQMLDGGWGLGPGGVAVGGVSGNLRKMGGGKGLPWWTGRRV